MRWRSPRPAAPATAVFIWSATTGAAASPGRSPIATRGASPRSRCCRGRIRTRSTGRCRCPTAIRPTGRGITRHFSSPAPRICCSPTTSGNCARGWRRPAFPNRRSTPIFPYSATGRRWRRHLPGIARAAPSARRSARSGSRPSTSGATRTTPWAAWRLKAPRISLPRPIASKFFPASVISPPTRRPIGSLNCCCSTSGPTRPESGQDREKPVSLGLVDIPEHRRRRAVEHAGQRLAPGAGLLELSERDIDHLVVDFLLDLGRDLLLLLRRRRTREAIAQLFDLVVLRPAEPSAILTSAANRIIGDGIDHVGRGPVGEEHVPATLLDRLLAGAATDHGAPVGSLDIDLEAGRAQQLRGDDRLRLQR